MTSVLVSFVIFLKFFIPALMLRYSFFGLWVNYILDVIDGDILLSLGLNDYSYQTLDKFTDLISYIFMVIVGRKWHIRKTVTILFFYRMTGQILFFFTRNELVFFFFQNFLEPLMMIYALILFKEKSESKTYTVYKKHLILIWGIILTYKIWNEWYLHFANIDLSLLLFGFNGGQ